MYICHMAFTDDVHAPAVRPIATTEDAILDAALETVSVFGVRRTTAAEIARRSGLSRQTLYRYWPDVPAILAALTTRELLALVEEPAEDARSVDELVNTIVETAQRMRDAPIFARFRESDPEVFARHILERLGSSQQALLADLEQRISRAQAGGIVRAGDPAAFAAMTLLIVQSAIQSALIMADVLPDPVWASELHRAVAGYLRPDLT